MWYTPEFLGTKPFFGIVLAVTVSAGAGYVYYSGGLPTDLFGSPPNLKPGGVHGAPGPLMGAAGLPLFVAYGVYRMVRRRRG
jgi:hypothetical protein